MVMQAARITRRGFIGATLVLVVLGPRLSGYAIGTGGTWAATGSMALPRNGPTLTVLQDGRVLATGGDYLLTTGELFDPQSGTWSRASGPMVTGRLFNTATLLLDGRVLLAGGFDVNGQATTSCELFDPATSTFTPTGSMAEGRAEHTATLFTSGPLAGQVLVAGGYDAQYDQLTSAELYNPTTGTWTTTGPLNVGRGAFAATLLPDGRVLASGDAAQTELYDPSTGTWALTGAMNVARAYSTATLLGDGTVLVAGGFDGLNPLASAEIYQPSMGTWTLTGSLNTARLGPVAVLLSSGQVLVSGGQNGSAFLASTELYAPTSGQWSVTGSMTTPRLQHAAVALPSGQVLVVGGSASPTAPYLASAELYTPGTSAQLAASLTSVRVGQALGLTGSRFASTEPVALSLDSTPLTTTTSSVTGTIAATITVPPATFGPHSLNAIGGASGLAASTTLSVTASLSLTAYVGGTGTSDTASGAGFGATERVVLHWNTAGGPTLGTTTSGALGSFGGASALHFTIPSGAKGWHRLYAIGTRTGAQATSALYHR